MRPRRYPDSMSPQENGQNRRLPRCSHLATALTSGQRSSGRPGLLAACDAALLHDGASISSFEADRRAQALRRVRARAGEALGSAVSWLR